MRPALNPCAISCVEGLESRCLLSTSPALAAPLTTDPGAPVVAQLASPDFTLSSSIVAHLHSVAPLTASTIPPFILDLNPHGAAFVPKGFPEGDLIHPTELIVSNFSDKFNQQGYGTSMIAIRMDRTTQTVMQQPETLGLDTGLIILRRGVTIVGYVPNPDSTGAGEPQGALVVLDTHGDQLGVIHDPDLLNGPWGMTVRDRGSSATIYVSNVLSGTISRLEVKVTRGGVHLEKIRQIASGYTHGTDPSAMVVGPAGLAIRHGTLYVASTADNAIYAIKNASTRRTDAGVGRLIYHDPAHLHGPVGLVVAPNGHLIASNGDAVNADPLHPSELTEFTRRGMFVSEFSIDSTLGAASGLAITTDHGEIFLGAVNDAHNTVSIWSLGRLH